jgi:hypothetical protein
MPQISFPEASDLLEKLFTERIRVHALLISPTGVRAQVKGLIDSGTLEVGLVVSSTRPSPDAAAIIVVPLGAEGCVFTYGELRELPEEIRLRLGAAERGESVLVMAFNSGDTFALFFTF